MRSNEDAIPIAILCTFGIVICGAIIGGMVDQSWRRWCVEQGYAQHNAKTGAWELVRKEGCE